MPIITEPCSICGTHVPQELKDWFEHNVTVNGGSFLTCHVCKSKPRIDALSWDSFHRKRRISKLNGIRSALSETIIFSSEQDLELAALYILEKEYEKWNHVRIAEDHALRTQKP